MDIACYFNFLGVYLGAEFQIHPVMNIKRNIIFAPESRKKNGVPIVDNVPIRMRVIYASHRIEFTTGYRIDAAKWDADKQYKTASNVKPQQAGDHMSQALGTVAFTLPHSTELEGQYLAGNLLADLSMKDSRVFRKEIEKIAREVFGC